MEDPNLIATLIPVDDEKWAEGAFRLPHNNARYLPPAGGIPAAATISSRETTPAWQQPNEDDYSLTHRIRLTFCQRPKDQQGYVFGTNSQVCDVLLGYRGIKGINGRHFCITFDEQARVILKDSSTWGTAVSYDGQARGELRHHFTWILSLDNEEKGKWKNIIVQVGGLKFKVELASHETCEDEFLENVNTFLELSRTALPPLDVLGIDSHKTTAAPSQALSPRQRPIYIKEKRLGSGSFGRVDRVADVSTGSTHATKEFHRSYRNERNKRERARQKLMWQEAIRNEIHIMMSYPHLRIVPVVEFREDPAPLLVMPYYGLGNLEDVHRESRITEEESVQTLLQCLEGLAHLHPHNVAHRDLKPANILVEDRDPFRIKIADFGFAKVAKDSSVLKTFCGTHKYAAPEIYSDRPYTTKVDMWPLGVFIFEYVYGLPEDVKVRRGKHKDEHTRMKEWGLTWCQRILDEANDLESDHLIDLLTAGMLRIEPDERLTASECLKKGYDLGLFERHTFDTRSARPIQPGPLQCDDSDDDGSANVILEALWGPEAIAGCEDNETVRLYNRGYPPGRYRGSHIPASLPSRITSIGSASSHANSQDAEKQFCSEQRSRSPDNASEASTEILDPASNEPFQSEPNGRRQSFTKSRTNGSYSQERETKRLRTRVSTDAQLPTEDRSGNGPPLPATHIDLQRAKAPDALKPSNPTILAPDSIGNVEGRCTREPGNGNVRSPPSVRIPKRTLLTRQTTGVCNISSNADLTLQSLNEDRPGYIQINVGEKTVSMRKLDRWVNATQILALSSKSADERSNTLRVLKMHTAVEIQKPNQWYRYRSSWVCFEHGHLLCKNFGLIDQLRSLLEYGVEVVTSEQRHTTFKDYLTHPYLLVLAGTNVLAIRETDFWVNLSHIVKATGRDSRIEIPEIRRRNPEVSFDFVRGKKEFKGTYVPFDIGLQFCQLYELYETAKQLQDVQETRQDLRERSATPVPHPQVQQQRDPQIHLSPDSTEEHRPAPLERTVTEIHENLHLRPASPHFLVTTRKSAETVRPTSSMAEQRVDTRAGGDFSSIEADSGPIVDSRSHCSQGSVFSDVPLSCRSFLPAMKGSFLNAVVLDLQPRCDPESFSIHEGIAHSMLGNDIVLGFNA